MAGTGDKIVTVKWTLTEANTVARALQAHRVEMLGQIADAGGLDRMPALGAAVGRIETILRRDFDQEPESGRITGAANRAASAPRSRR